MPACYARADDVVMRRIAGETILVPVKGTLADLQRVFVLEGVGDFVWEQLDGARTVVDLQQAIAATYAMGPANPTPDIEVFLNELETAGLVHRKS